MKVRIGNKLMEVESWTKIDGKIVPVIKATTEKIKHPDGTEDVIVHVPCLQISNELKKGQ